MPRLLLLVALLPAAAFADDPTRLFPDGKKPADQRLAKVRTLNFTDFFLKPPATLAAWNVRRHAVREQLLVANGLWPLPPRTQLNPVVHRSEERRVGKGWSSASSRPQ